jgi:hypothetical protein
MDLLQQGAAPLDALERTRGALLWLRLKLARA